MAIRGCTRAVYPAGRSDFAQVAGAAPLDATESCDAMRPVYLPLRRRQLALLLSSILWYSSEDGPGNVEFKPHLETLLAADNKSTS